MVEPDSFESVAARAVLSLTSQMRTIPSTVPPPCRSPSGWTAKDEYEYEPSSVDDRGSNVWTVVPFSMSWNAQVESSEAVATNALVG